MFQRKKNLLQRIGSKLRPKRNTLDAARDTAEELAGKAADQVRNAADKVKEAAREPIESATQAAAKGVDASKSKLEQAAAAVRGDDDSGGARAAAERAAESASAVLGAVGEKLRVAVDSVGREVQTGMSRAKLKAAKLVLQTQLADAQRALGREYHAAATADGKVADDQARATLTRLIADVDGLIARINQLEAQEDAVGDDQK